MIIKSLQTVTLIIFLLCSVSSYSQSRISKLVYKKKSNIDVASKKKNKAMELFLKETFLHMEKVEYMLLFNDKASSFKQVRKMRNDLDKKSLSIKVSEILGGGEGIYYTERKTKKSYHQTEFESELYLIEIDKKLDWNLTQEKKKIGKYVCYKATTEDTSIGSSGSVLKKKIIVWYTPEIPFGYGPLKYNGLPGLILELENDQVIYYTKEIQLHLKDKIDIEKPKKGIQLTRTEFDKTMMGLATDFRKRHKRN